MDEHPNLEDAASPALPADSGTAANVPDALVIPYEHDPLADPRTLVYGDVLEGAVRRVGSWSVTFDLGFAGEAFVPEAEFARLTSGDREALQPGTTIPLFVVNAVGSDGRIVVSIMRARAEMQWWSLEELFEANTPVEGRVTSNNHGGLIVNVHDVSGFVPYSQVSWPQSTDRATRQSECARLIGMTLPMKIIDIDRHRRHLILKVAESYRAFRKREFWENRARRLSESGESGSSPGPGSEARHIAVGDIVRGRVTRLVHFGAHVDIGEVDGFIPLRELGWGRIRHPETMFAEGDEIDVAIVVIDQESQRVVLSAKQMQDDPWHQFAATHHDGDMVRGVVEECVNFGAFVRMVRGVEGLLHNSELSHDAAATLRADAIVTPGMALIVRILHIDPERRRIALSLRSALDAPDSDLIACFGEGILDERDALKALLDSASE